MKQIILLSLLLFLLSGCGSPFAGTGQHGEAKMVGVVMTSAGTPAANQPVAIADNNYVTSSSAIQARSSATIDTVITDTAGRFEVELDPGRVVTISAKIGTSLLYLPDVTVSDTVQNLGNLTFAEGKPVTVYPWWEQNGSDELFTVKGTDWGFVLDELEESQIYLPGEKVDLIHYDVDSVVTIEIIAGEKDYIGDKTDSIPFFLPDTAPLGTDVFLKIADSFDYPVYYHIFWGDSLEPEKSETGQAVHIYQEPGIYEVTVWVFPLAEIEEMPVAEYWQEIEITEKKEVDGIITREKM